MNHTKGLVEADVMFTVSKRADFDPIRLAHVLRNARKRAGMTVREVADAVGVPITEAEHWFRTDRFNSPPDAAIWEDVRGLLGIEGWGEVGVTIPIPNVFEMGGRAYHESGLSPTVTANQPNWIIIEG